MAIETIEQNLTRYLYTGGMFENDAKAIMADYKASDLAKAMKNRWNDPASEYPVPLMTTLVIGLNHIAVEWIDKNAPKHWARPMFAGDAASGIAP